MKPLIMHTTTEVIVVVDAIFVLVLLLLDHYAVDAIIGDVTGIIWVGESPSYLVAASSTSSLTSASIAMAASFYPILLYFLSNIN